MSKETRPTFKLIKEEVTEEETPFVSGRRIVVWVVALFTFLWRYMEPTKGIFPGIEVSQTELYSAWWLVLSCMGLVLFVLDTAFWYTQQRRRAVGIATDIVFVLLIVLQIFFGPVLPE